MWVFLQQQKPVSALFSTVVVKVKVEANLAFSVVEALAGVRFRIGEGGSSCTKQCEILDGSGQHRVQLCGYHCCVATTKATLPDRWASFQFLGN